MAVVVVQIGQCGNQLGEELWRQLAITTNNGTAPSPFFTSEGKARCVLVDTEPKVVQGVCARHPGRFRAENVISGQSGRGNHWALGYYGVSHPMSVRSAENAAVTRPFRVVKDQRERDRCVASDALRAIHMETRRTCDAVEFEAIVVLHSLVGGTGSGMTSLLMEKIRYYFIEPPEDEPIDERAEAKMMRRDGLDGILVEKRRAAHLVSITVAPQAAGELSTQGLNAALTLHALQQNADVVILLRNDDYIHDASSNNNPKTDRRTSASGGPIAPSFIKPCSTFREVNEVLVTLLMPILLYGGGTNALGELVVKCSPNYRKMNNILTLVHTPQRSYYRYGHSATLSRHYIVTGAKLWLPGTRPSVPHELIHTQRSLATLDLAASELDVQVPRALLQSFRDVPAGRKSPVCKLYDELEGVLVLNETRELDAAVLFPLLRSASLKVKAGAFLTTFVDLGLPSACIEAAIREVAERLADAEEM